LVYEINKAENGGEYYSSLTFIVPPVDTMVLGLSIVYSAMDIIIYYFYMMILKMEILVLLLFQVMAVP
jgi:hypothetical protein